MKIKRFNESAGRSTMYIDMDDVLCDFYNAARKNMSENPGQKFPQSKVGFFLNLKPMEGAIDAFKKLSEKYDVWILTRPSSRNINSYSEKAQWVLNNFGYDVLKKTIMSHDKSLLKGDYLIDDSNNANQDKFEGELIKFGSDKFPDWKAVLDYLL